jgi:hypothetical protein
MKTQFFFSIVVFAAINIFVLSCEAQTESDLGTVSGSVGQSGQNSANIKPDIKYKVTKKFDDKGNLIAYDSTSVYTYSAHGTENSAVNSDSIFASLPPEFQNLQGFMGIPFDNLFNDNDLEKNLFDSDFFSQSFPQDSLFMGVFRQTDSLQRSFLKKPEKKLNHQ